MAHIITIDSAAENLNRHAVTYAPEVKQQLRTGLEFEKMLPFVQADKVYTSTNVKIGSLIQPYQPRFTPKNTESFDAVDNVLRPIKIDLEFTEDQLMEFYDKWAVNWANPEGDQKSKTYYQYIMSDLIAPKYQEEMNSLSWSGVYVAPTPGVAGEVLDSADGFNINLTRAITAGKVVPIPSGSYTASDIRQKLEDWMMSMPVAVRSKPGTIYMSDTWARKYYYDYRGDFSVATWQSLQKNGGYAIDGFNVKIQPMASMEGSNRWIFVPDSAPNMICGTRKGYAKDPQFTFDGDLYTLKAKAVIHRFYGFEYWEHTFVNDQA